jgi:uncharacterized protein YjiS (DUF1127 family)
MTTTVLKNRSVFRHTTVAATPAALLGRAWVALRLWRERARQRTHLAEISPQMLNDIGISRTAARAEAGKPFWLA